MPGCAGRKRGRLVSILHGPRHWAPLQPTQTNLPPANALQATNVGDSSAFFIDPATGRARELTEDHRLTNPRERQRLQDMGIQVGVFWSCFSLS